MLSGEREAEAESKTRTHGRVVGRIRASRAAATVRVMQGTKVGAHHSDSFQKHSIC